MAKQVIRGPKGRFESIEVPDEAGVEKNVQRQGVVDHLETPVRSQGDQIVWASVTLFNTIISFSDVLFRAGMIRNNSLANTFGIEPQPSSNYEQAPTPHEASSLEGVTGLLQELRQRQQDIRESNTVFGAAYYFARPATQLLRYLLTLAAGDTEDNAYVGAFPLAAERDNPSIDINPINVSASLNTTYYELYEQHNAVTAHLFGTEGVFDKSELDLEKASSIYSANANVIEVLEDLNRMVHRGFIDNFASQFGIVA